MEEDSEGNSEMAESPERPSIEDTAISNTLNVGDVDDREANAPNRPRDSEVQTQNEQTPGDVEPVASSSAPRYSTRTSAIRRRSYRLRNRETRGSSSEDDLPIPSRHSPQHLQDSEVPAHILLNLPSDVSSTSDSSNGSRFSLYERARAEKKRLDNAPTPEVLLKTKPKHKWFMAPEIVNRELGFSNRSYGSKHFENRMYGSLHAVQRLELMYKLEQHNGCVNSINFNDAGTLLASCSDDLSICLWDWAVGKIQSIVQTGHRGNVFQAKFLPLQGHIYLATCARDGQVRIIELREDGSLALNRRVGSHYRSCNKIALVNDSPHCFYSCGEDAVVLIVDTRQKRGKELLSVGWEGRHIPLYTISTHPIDSNEFMVGGRNRHLYIYDRRCVKSPVTRICPSQLVDKKEQAYITSAVYNHDGSQLLASYNDDDIYLWDRRDTLSDIVHKYQGHRNNATLKGVNFFGPRSEYVVSGSDCGNIFFWDRETEAIVQWMPGDENGVVNCLEPHPRFPVLATSGLDDDVKIWVPSCERDPVFTELKSTVIINQKDRADGRMDISQPEDLDGQVLWLLWRHLSGENRDESNRNDSQDNPMPSSSVSSEQEEDEEPSAPTTNCTTS